MTQFDKDLGLQSAFFGVRAVRLLGVLTAMLLSFAAATSQAQVRLENTIKKVETFVNEAGDVQRRLVDAERVVPGDELQYIVRFTNAGEQPVDAGTIVITDQIPPHTEYLEGTAYGSGTDIAYSLDGQRYAQAGELMVAQQGQEMPATADQYNAIQWTFGPALEPGQSSYVSFNVRLK